IHSQEGYLGTLWIYSHDENCVFTEDDATVMTGLADLAAVVLGRCMAGDFRPWDARGWGDHPAGVAVENAHLRSALREAQEQEDELFALLGHELKQPLSSMITALHLVHSGGLASRSMDMIERQVDHLVRLVDELVSPSPPIHSSIKMRLKTKPAHEPVE